MQTRPSNFFDTKTAAMRYGIKVFHRGRWINAGDDDGLFLFKTEAEREAKRAELRKQQLPTGT